MAKVSFGSGVAEIRGSIGGTVYSRNSGGAYIRTRIAPIQPGSTRQEEAKSVFAAGVNNWTNALSQLQRDMWAAYAAAVPYTDIFGATRYYSGQVRYVQAYACAINAGVASATVAEAPLVYTAASPVNASSVAVNQGAAVADATFTLPDVLAPEDVEVGDMLLVYMGNKVTEATSYYKGPYRYAGKLTYASGDSFPGATFDDPWGQTVTEGDTRSVRVKVLKADNRLSPYVRQILTVGAHVA